MAKKVERPKESNGSAPIDDPWQTKPGLIRRFLEQSPQYEQLCAEVQYMLRKRLSASGIEIATISSRAKTLNSFLEKLERKEYEDPLVEMTDFAGVRVVCLYISDIAAIEKIVLEEFEVIEKVDKLHDKELDQFGYGAVHYITTLGPRSSGARYDDLKGLACEIQVRTVLQDAWAIIDHHLVYKQESAVPTPLQRKLNSLAGLFETADDQFQQIREQREDYVEQVRKSIATPSAFLATEVNLDTLKEYLSWKFKGVPTTGRAMAPKILGKLQNAGYTTLGDLDQAFESAADNWKQMEKDPWAVKYEGGVPGIVRLYFAIATVDAKLRKMMDISKNSMVVIKKYCRSGKDREKRAQPASGADA